MAAYTPLSCCFGVRMGIKRSRSGVRCHRTHGGICHCSHDSHCASWLEHAVGRRNQGGARNKKVRCLRSQAPEIVLQDQPVSATRATLLSDFSVVRGGHQGGYRCRRSCLVAQPWLAGYTTRHCLFTSWAARVQILVGISKNRQPTQLSSCFLRTILQPSGCCLLFMHVARYGLLPSTPAWRLGRATPSYLWGTPSSLKPDQLQLGVVAMSPAHGKAASKVVYARPAGSTTAVLEAAYGRRRMHKQRKSPLVRAVNTLTAQALLAAIRDPSLCSAVNAADPPAKRPSKTLAPCRYGRPAERAWRPS